MAEIHIERKRRIGPFLVILILIVLAVVGWFGYNSYWSGAPRTVTDQQVPAVLRAVV